MNKFLFNALKLTRATFIIWAVFGLTGVLILNHSMQADTLMSQSQDGSSTSTSTEAKLVVANNRFGFKIFSEILKSKGDENIFISPSSIAIALAMAYNGADGETQQAMAQTLELQGMSLQEVNQGNAILKAALENPDPQVQLAIANSLWARQGITFDSQYVQQIEKFYAAKVTAINFSSPDALSIINNWVQQNTKGKINKIIDKIQPNSILFLLNAIYFKGKWTKPFEKAATQERPFTLLNGVQKQHLLMFQFNKKYPYYENELFQAVSLPYGQGRLSFYVFLPKENIGLQRFYENLTAENWEQWMQQFKRTEGTIGFPRFKLEYEISLNNVLKMLGMEIAFDVEQADFSKMRSTSPNSSAENISFDEVKHKTFVEVNEEGTEAAAVTGISMRTLSVPLAKFNMMVDRPFFCAIRDNQTGTLLFMGSIVEPK